jgi:hypothetical protein
MLKGKKLKFLKDYMDSIEEYKNICGVLIVFAWIRI